MRSAVAADVTPGVFVTSTPAAAGLDVDEVVTRAVVRDDAEVRHQLERPFVDGLGNHRQRLHLGPLTLERPVEVLDVVELVPGRARKRTGSEDFQTEGWRRGLEPRPPGPQPGALPTELPPPR